MPETQQAALLAHSARVIREGSKSFALASFLLGSERRDAAALLYHWCRYCDDAVDRASSAEERMAKVGELERLTRMAFAGGSEALPPAFDALRAVACRFGIPERYALDLLEAMRADAEGRRYRDLSSLIRYCYGAAGTVGLMMAHVLGVSDERALRHAMDLGISMQLVNIARDIAEDHAMGRVYLPLEWLEEAGVPIDSVPKDTMLEPAHRKAVYAVVQRLISEAEAFRESGEAGIRYLSFRSSIAIRAASRIYWEIAVRVKRGGPRSLERRAVVPGAVKLYLIFRSIMSEALRLPLRWMSHWRAATIRTSMGPPAASFLREVVIYASRVRQFNAMDWASYVAWVGLIFGLFIAIGAFLWLGRNHGVSYPAYVWNLPIGAFIFCGAIAFDTIGHRTVYKAEISKGENLVHHITIFAGITSCLALCLAYSMPEFWRIPAISLIALSIFYSIIDEALHWRRYLNLHSDRVEMWSHFFIFLGHTIMIFSWYQWFERGYPGVAETLRHIPLSF